MEILHIAVPAAIILVAFAIAVFWWAVKHGQFDDLERQGMNILLDEDTEQQKKKRQQDKQQKQAEQPDVKGSNDSQS